MCGLNHPHVLFVAGAARGQVVPGSVVAAILDNVVSGCAGAADARAALCAISAECRYSSPVCAIDLQRARTHYSQRRAVGDGDAFARC